MAGVTDPIPTDLFRRLKDFLDARKSGQVVFDVKDGRILSGHATEHWPKVDSNSAQQ